MNFYRPSAITVSHVALRADFYCKTDIFPSFRLILAKYAKKSSQIWYFENKHTS